MATQHKVGQKVWYDGEEAKIVKIGLPDALGTNDGVEIELRGTRGGRIKTSPLDHRLTEKKNQTKPSLHSLLNETQAALGEASESLSGSPVKKSKPSASARVSHAVKAASSPTITVRDKRGKDRKATHEIELDKYVDDQLEEAFGEQALKSLLLVIVDAEDFDKDALKELTSGGGIKVEELVTLGELCDEYSHDVDMVAAAIIAADGDIDHAKNLAENVMWVGSHREDEDDYAQYVIDEGLMGDNLANYFDMEAYGRDLMTEVSAVEVDGQLVIFHG